ncbi:ubiquitin carboxyl-terminal hydrolase-domain-containing protein [Microdochium trichocladiopsis]|uniref:ubiquitinyl hydrolase 1 n=1 Tax=Microdochium trichocladiopsis TaxID=1682393 RepID=A0A9P8Y997_9PEZI|nr:ubiquitin carboxyl-terminal hydrolase-domain-containing protein [Microdochium trichocladiopsis]KAH7033125.1 ubiquitin carboxyl-terminal hydrolase-domain-containing protein [Microdochium trichocladiopsis]
MKATGLPKRFLSRKDKQGHRRDKSSDASHKHRSSDFFSLLKRDSAKTQENEQAKEDAKAFKQRVIELNHDLAIASLNDEHIRYALRHKYSSGDVDKAIELLALQKKSFQGQIIPYNSNVHMLGAENRGAVTCYLDSLLFAMFAKLESFECMLKHEIDDPAAMRLAALLRLWVNMLRSGKLIEADMTHHIQDALADCGWKDAQLLEQQDTSEAFGFITETLQLPLMPLQVDLFHHGKNDDADHKVVYERLLNLAVPEDTDGKGVDLEDCLEEYFNTQVDVQREGSTDDKKVSIRTTISQVPLTPDTPSTPLSAIRIGDDVRECQSPAEDPDKTEQLALERSQTAISLSVPASSQPAVRPHRARTESIIQRVVIDPSGKPTDTDTASLFQRAKRSASVVKAVTIPAWQFFKLIPWHSAANNEPQSDLEVARHFSQRPVVGICLKRYMMDEHGNMCRKNTYIDIPDSLRLPQFIADERLVEENGLSADYKLVLQSVVCHRGDSLHSGHYISFCRVAPKLLTDNRMHESDPPPDYEEAQWVKFDDLCIEQRIAPVDDIKQALKEEMPYLLFYQIVPIVDMTASSTDGTSNGPPSYNDSRLNITVSESDPSPNRPPVSRQTSSYFDNTGTGPSTSSSIRFSSELERPPRRSFADEDGFLTASRRASVALVDVGSPRRGRTPDSHSPATSPGEETTAQRLSRAAAKFKSGSKSRPQSPSGEGRISLTMSRLGFRRASREMIRDTTTTTDNEEDFVEVAVVDGAADEKDTDKGGKSHGRGDKPKSRLRHGKAKADVPDRECVVQ